MKKRIVYKIIRNYEKVLCAHYFGTKIPKIPFHSDEEVKHLKDYACRHYWPWDQFMTTPTKEQIEHIGKNMPTWGCEFGGECVPAPEVIEKIITEWEKIRGK